MAILPLQLARVSNLLRQNVATQRIAQTQQSLLEVQNELSSGKKINSPGPTQSEGVTPCRMANFTRLGRSLTPSFCISRLR